MSVGLYTEIYGHAWIHLLAWYVLVFWRHLFAWLSIFSALTFLRLFRYLRLLNADPGCKVFNYIKGDNVPFSYKFVNMIMACTGGGILVPIFINSIPVPMAQDAYPIAIFISFMLHTYFPIMREVVDLSPVFKVC